MTTGWDNLTASIQAAIDGAIKDNPDLFANLVNVTGGGGGNTSGTESLDPISLVLGLGLLTLAGSPEVLAIVESLKQAAGGAGGNAESFGSGYFLGYAAWQFAEPYMRYVTHFIENEAQSQIFDPATAADLSARQIITPAFGQSEAGGGGFDQPHWAGMLDASYNRPSWDVALRLWNRGYINENDVNAALQYGAVPEYWWPILKQLKQELLTPADLALATLRQSITQEQGAAGAAMWGLDADDFNTLLLNTGEPLGLMQMLEAFRRGFIDQDTLEQGIRQSRVRDEWIPTAIDLRYAPMSTAAAANAVVRGYLSATDGQAIAEQNGLEPDHWQYVLESNGRPLSHEQMLTLYYRGLVDLQDVKSAIQQSDVKDEYIDDAIELGVRLLPLFEAVSLLKDGNITGATFSSNMLDQGYQKATIDEIIASTGTGKAATAKHLTVADIADMYEDGSISHDTAVTKLVAIGYTTDDAGAILDNADVKAKATQARTLITAVKTSYTHYRIDADTAKSELTTLGVDAATIKRLIDDWTTVRPAGTKLLTESQVMKLLKETAITNTDALTRLQALGYTEADAQLLIQAYG